jgi:hypothetical protein
MTTCTRHLLTALAGLATITAPAFAQRDSAAVARNAAPLAQIDSFFAHPFNRTLARSVFVTASDRPDVMVSLESTLMPWLCYDDKPPALKTLGGILTIGYVAGDMRAQLESGRKSEDPQASLRGILTAYNAIQRRVPNYTIPEVELWKTTDEGHLAQLTDSLLRHPPSCKKKPLPLRGPVTLSPSDTL